MNAKMTRLNLMKKKSRMITQFKKRTLNYQNLIKKSKKKKKRKN